MCLTFDVFSLKLARIMRRICEIEKKKIEKWPQVAEIRIEMLKIRLILSFFKSFNLHFLKKGKNRSILS